RLDLGGPATAVIAVFAEQHDLLVAGVCNQPIERLAGRCVAGSSAECNKARQRRNSPRGEDEGHRLPKLVPEETVGQRPDMRALRIGGPGPVATFCVLVVAD